MSKVVAKLMPHPSDERSRFFLEKGREEVRRASTIIARYTT